VALVNACVTALCRAELNTVLWLLRETFEPENTSSTSFLRTDAISPTLVEVGCGSAVVEVGPRMSFTSAFSTNATSICANCGVPVERLERYRRFTLHLADGSLVTDEPTLAAFSELVHDRMTEWRVRVPITTFEIGVKPESVRAIPLLSAGRPALEHVNKEMGLSMDAWDLEFYYNLFVNDLKRDPTDVELFDICQSNSEHSRHWFFKGKMVLDGKEQERTLMQLVQGTLDAQPGNSIIAFADNSSAISGFRVQTLESAAPGKPATYKLSEKLRHCLLTAETHNFPTGVAPFPGAETGTGGRIRDTHATGRGSHVVAGTAAYCVGNLCIPGYPLPWEDVTFQYPSNLASPLRIELDASNGASDYGNKFGEPVVAGFTRSFGLRMANGDRREYIKPIMFTAGVGIIDDDHTVKGHSRSGHGCGQVGWPCIPDRHGRQRSK
jgi:phosphoribosylformylglycinamidine synthase